MTDRHWHLSSESTSVQEARTAVRNLLADLTAASDHVEAAVLIVSELVTNAIRHANGAEGIEIDVQAHPGMVRLVVVDHDPLPPVRRERPPLDAGTESGRGLVLVEQLSTEWGWSPIAGNGKSVWCTIESEAPPEARRRARRPQRERTAESSLDAARADARSRR